MKHIRRIIAWNTARWHFFSTGINGRSPGLGFYKNLWVRHNRHQIISAAGRYNILPDLLAAIAWYEVGGEGADNDMKHPLASGMPADPHWLRQRSKKEGGWDTGNMERLLAQDADHLDHLAGLLNGVIRTGLNGHTGRHLTDEQIKQIGVTYFYGTGLTPRLSQKYLQDNAGFGSQLLRYREHVRQLLG